MQDTYFDQAIAKVSLYLIHALSLPGFSYGQIFPRNPYNYSLARVAFSAVERGLSMVSSLGPGPQKGPQKRFYIAK